MFLKNKIELLMKRASFCKPSIGLLKREEIDGVAKQLEVCFSDDFYQINENYAYEGLYGACIEFLCLYDNRDGYSGVIEETTGNRKALNLPHRYVMLSDMGDGGGVLLETQDSPEEPSPVIWCDLLPDFFNICEEKPMEQNPTIWPSFTDFFEYLVEQEEESLQKGKV